MTDNIKLPFVVTSEHPEFPVLAWSPLEIAAINRLMREAVRLNAQAVPDGWKLVPVDATDEMVKVGDQKTWVYPSRECWAAMLSAAPAAPRPAQAVPDGMVLVPKRLTREMESVINNEDWRWEDLLAAAEAITLDEYSEVAASPAAPQPAQPLTDEQINAGRQALPYDIEDKPEPWAFKEGVRFAEQAHGIGVKS